MLFQALGIGLLQIIAGFLSGAYSNMRAKGTSRFTSFIMSSLALYCSFKILLQIVNAPNKDKVRFKKKFLFILYGFSVALDLSCDAIASVLESIMTSNPTIRTQYRSVANRQTRIVKSSIAEMMNLQLA